MIARNGKGRDEISILVANFETMDDQEWDFMMVWKI